MLFSDYLVLMRGGGDLATGVAYRLHKAGFPLIVLELAQPLVVRRAVALATAVHQGGVQIEDLRGERVPDVAAAAAMAAAGEAVPVLVAPDLDPVLAGLPAPPAVIVDARIAKRNIDTDMGQAPLVIGMGPGFSAGIDCHAVIETMRGHTLGRVLWRGSPLPNTGTPGIVAGKGAERVLRAPQDGVAAWEMAIGDLVEKGQRIGVVDGAPVAAPFAGVIRGLVAPGTPVRRGMKIGDVDARGRVENCFTISDKALTMGGAALTAILTWMNRAQNAA
jgi:xanthine dehydrogenase accessory factor